MGGISGDLKEQKLGEKCFEGWIDIMAFILFHSCFSSGYERLACCNSSNCCVSKALSANTGILFGLFLTITSLSACAASAYEDIAKRDIGNRYSSSRSLA